MIVETATITVVDGRAEEFLAALEQAKAVLAQSPGWRDITVHRGIERPATFRLVIGWETLEDHTIRFRDSDLFTQWRALIGPYFAAPPEVEHWTIQ